MSVPKLRFREFRDEWENSTLSNYGNVLMNKRIFKNETFDKGDIPFYKIGTFGKKATSFITREKFTEYKNKYPYPRVGDILMSASGTLGNTVVYDGKDSYYQDSNIVWLNNDKTKLDNSFLLQFYKKHKWSNVEGSTIKRLYNKDILNTKINVPSLSEQQKIGSFFQKLDQLINLQTKKIEHLKRLKRGYLQKMFVKHGAKVPELRFDGFDGEWNDRKVKDLLLIGKSGGTPSTKEKKYYNGKIPFLSISDLTTSDGYIEDTEKHISIEGLNNSSSWIVPKGALTISMYASVGKVALFENDIATSQAFFNMMFNSDIDTNYMYFFFQNVEVNHLWNRLISTGTQQNLNANKINNFKLFIPTLLEQEKISDFLLNLDKQIKYFSNNLENIIKIKKGFLQKMFL